MLHRLQEQKACQQQAANILLLHRHSLSGFHLEGSKTRTECHNNKINARVQSTSSSAVKE
jgi:hypothetical protein